MNKLGFMFAVLLLVSFFSAQGNLAIANEKHRNGMNQKDASLQIRRHAAYKLGEVRDLSAVPTLVAYLQDDDMHLRRIAARALGKIGSPEAVMPLIEVLCRPDQHRQVQLAAICSLGRIGDPRASRTLEHMAEHEAGAIRQRAAENYCRLHHAIKVSRLVTMN